MSALADLRGSSLASLETPRPTGRAAKRVVDIVLALSGIFLLAPLFVICFLATAFTSPGPALFRHRRVGFDGKHFDCLKFRTMVTDAPDRLRRFLESSPEAAAEWATNRSCGTIRG
jgi:exopolysaccharide production protein ExoY